MSLAAWIPEFIRQYGLWAVVAGVAIETIIVPLPSPLILMAAGFILIPQGSLLTIASNALLISVIAGVAQTIGSYLVYGFARWLGPPFIEKYERFHGVSWDDIEKFQEKFEGRKESVTLFFLRALPIMPLSVVSGVAGVMEMPVRQYTLATFLGTIPRNLILALAGFSLGEFYMVMAERIDHAETIMTLILVGLIVFYVIGNRTGLFDWMRKKVL